MTSGISSRAAWSRRSILTGLAAVAVAPVLPADAAGDPSAKAFLQQIYQNYVGSSGGTAKGVQLAAAKEVRGYFTVGLATLILEDRASAAKRGEPPALDGDPFVGHQDWDISNLAVEGEGHRRQGDRDRHVHQFRQAGESRARAASLRQGLAHRRYPVGLLEPARPLPQEGGRVATSIPPADRASGATAVCRGDVVSRGL